MVDHDGRRDGGFQIQIWLLNKKRARGEGVVVSHEVVQRTDYSGSSSRNEWRDSTTTC